MGTCNRATAIVFVFTFISRSKLLLPFQSACSNRKSWTQTVDASPGAAGPERDQAVGAKHRDERHLPNPMEVRERRRTEFQEQLGPGLKWEKKSTLSRLLLPLSLPASLLQHHNTHNGRSLSLSHFIPSHNCPSRCSSCIPFPSFLPFSFTLLSFNPPCIHYSPSDI